MLHMLLIDVLLAKPTPAAGGVGVAAVKQLVADLLKVRACETSSTVILLDFRVLNLASNMTTHVWRNW